MSYEPVNITINPELADTLKVKELCANESVINGEIKYIVNGKELNKKNKL